MKVNVGDILRDEHWYYKFQYKENDFRLKYEKHTLFELKKLYPNVPREIANTMWWSNSPYQVSRKDVLRMLKGKHLTKVTEEELAIVYLLNDDFVPPHELMENKRW